MIYLALIGFILLWAVEHERAADRDRLERLWVAEYHRALWTPSVKWPEDVRTALPELADALSDFRDAGDHQRRWRPGGEG